MGTRMPWDDAQDVPPLDCCERCGGELYGREAEPDGDGRVYCPECREALDREYDAETATAVLEAVDAEMAKYLSKELRNTIWNVMVKRFPIKEAS